MKFLVGYQYREEKSFLKSILEMKNSVSEVFFPWGDFANGRSPLTETGKITDRDMKAAMLPELRQMAEAGIGMNLLLNGNCYGSDALARDFYEKVGNTVDFLRHEVNLSYVTTTSPVIARFLKMNFTGMEVRASVNMSIGSIAGMEYVEDLFDSFYLKREYNRDFEKMGSCVSWCKEHGKKLYILANSGCLNDCSVETFHDNLVAHEAEIAKKDNAFEFHGQCRNYLGTEEHRAKWLSRTNFIRPEEVHLYEDFCDGMKLATRVNKAPGRVLQAYVRGKYSGSLPALLEPDHSGLFYPGVIENSLLPENFTKHVLYCKKDCEHCNYCKDVQKKATVSFE